MKKTLIFAGLLAIGFASAQEGKVGINTETPQATLEVQPNAANLRGTSNEGIIAPKLSKERIAAIATPVEGTLVYATDTTYTGTNAKVTKIDAKGYYFYNGTEWVKINTKAYTGSTSVELNGDSFERAALTGDVTADKNSNVVTVTRLQGRPVSSATPTEGDVLEWDGSAWELSNRVVKADGSKHGNVIKVLENLGSLWLTPTGSLEIAEDGTMKYRGRVELLRASRTPFSNWNCTIYPGDIGEEDTFRTVQKMLEQGYSTVVDFRGENVYVERDNNSTGELRSYRHRYCWRDGGADENKYFPPALTNTAYFYGEIEGRDIGRTKYYVFGKIDAAWAMRIK